ncbi:MAG: hypothetical protein M3R02_14500 [Chloroflexota bacterium]|nr:hypothetical protein [Chloroflexota bacterium]
MREFVPVAPYQGRRGFDQTPTRRLRELLDRYRGLRDNPDSAPAVRDYARSVVREIQTEFARREAKRQAEAA